MFGTFQFKAPGDCLRTAYELASLSRNRKTRHKMFLVDPFGALDNFCQGHQVPAGPCEVGVESGLF